ncbi:hypothetical protein EMIT047CA2_150096 [Pseudomonas soli]
MIGLLQQWVFQVLSFVYSLCRKAAASALGRSTCLVSGYSLGEGSLLLKCKSARGGGRVLAAGFILIADSAPVDCSGGDRA